MTTPLSLERFSALLAAYGGQSELWPEAERTAALALCSASAAARALLAEEAELDARLASAAVPPELEPDLWRRLNEVPLRAPQRRAWWPFRSAWVPAFGWALAAVVGLGWGLESPPFEHDELAAGAAVAAVDSAAPDSVPADDDLAALAGGALSELEE